MKARAREYLDRQLFKRHQDKHQKLLSKLERVYSGTGVQRDVFGRRGAFPHEIERSLATARRSAAPQKD